MYPRLPSQCLHAGASNCGPQLRFAMLCQRAGAQRETILGFLGDLVGPLHNHEWGIAVFCGGGARSVFDPRSEL